MIEFLKSALEITSKYGLPLPLFLTVGFLFVFFAFGVNWSEREKHYCDILKNLGIWKDTLSDRLDYYQMPGSEYNDEHIETDHYQRMQEQGHQAFIAVRQQINVARVFLSKTSVSMLDELIGEHWYIKEHGSACTKDYLELTLKAVNKANDSILKDARSDFKKSQYLKIIQNAFKK